MRVATILSVCVLLGAAVEPGNSATLSRATSPHGLPGAEDTLSPAIVRDVVDTAVSQIERVYVDADTAMLISARLRSRLRSGAYADVSDENRLAALMTADLRSVNHDLHLFVEFVPAGIAAAGTMSPPAVLSRSNHFALGKIEVLPGNIGYMEFMGFANDTAAESAVVGALEYLKSTDAIIIDVRRNGGGAPSSVNFLISHFTGRDTLASLKVSSRTTSVTRYTMASVPGPRRPDVPLYVLTSAGTASGAEDFAFVLQNLKRATIVGDRTAGAGHMTTLVPLGHGFFASISNRRGSDPRTGKEWERVGVQPDVRVEATKALDVAQILALQALEAKASGDERARLEFLRGIREAMLKTHDVANTTLHRYVGAYDADRHVRLANGRLVYQHLPAMLADTLVSLSDSTFVTSAGARLIFAHDARGAIEIHVETPDGERLVVPRNSAKAP